MSNEVLAKMLIREVSNYYDVRFNFKGDDERKLVDDVAKGLNYKLGHLSLDFILKFMLLSNENRKIVLNNCEKGNLIKNEIKSFD